MASKVRTRYAPSPTGYMHIGNLRTALYEYLISKSAGGDFILRIEDTDKGRYVQRARDIIYDSLQKAGLHYDEGPDIGGRFGPYIQSQRLDIYKKYAQKLLDEGKAYCCFCSKERLETLKQNGDQFSGYDRKCRNLSKEEVEDLKSRGLSYVIRQKMPLEGETAFTDEVFGEVKVENKELDDQILVKADGYPTYNFANVIDDHEMAITHVVRGCEYLSSTPKYNLLYQAFGWEIPKYIHLPLIMGENEDGSVSKLSKRHGAVSFEDLLNDGYLAEAVVNYIALLGWCPDGNQEIFSLDELVKEFSIDRISKSPSVFDYDKLSWFNGEYIRNKTENEFLELCEPYILKGIGDKNLSLLKIANVIQKRVVNLNEIPDMVRFLAQVPDYSLDLFCSKKSKTNPENSFQVLKNARETLNDIEIWDYDSIHDCLITLAQNMGVKNGTAMWPVRIAVSGQSVTPGGAIEILEILGKTESVNRIDKAIEKLGGL